MLSNLVVPVVVGVCGGAYGAYSAVTAADSTNANLAGIVLAGLNGFGIGFSAGFFGGGCGMAFGYVASLFQATNLVSNFVSLSIATISTIAVEGYMPFEKIGEALGSVFSSKSNKAQKGTEDVTQIAYNNRNPESTNPFDDELGVSDKAYTKGGYCVNGDGDRNPSWLKPSNACGQAQIASGRCY